MFLSLGKQCFPFLHGPPCAHPLTPLPTLYPYSIIFCYFSQEHKVLLTGTPLQNTVEELFSLLHFLEPTQFPSETEFLREFGDLKTEEQVWNKNTFIGIEVTSIIYKVVYETFTIDSVTVCNNHST